MEKHFSLAGYHKLQKFENKRDWIDKINEIAYPQTDLRGKPLYLGDVVYYNNSELGVVTAFKEIIKLGNTESITSIEVVDVMELSRSNFTSFPTNMVHKLDIEFVEPLEIVGIEDYIHYKMALNLAKVLKLHNL